LTWLERSQIHSPTTTSAAHGTKVLSLVCLGHFVSHFLTLTLPPLFPFLREDFGLGFTELGLIMTLYAAATGLAQIPMGFVVDRVGAFPVMLTGLVILCLAIGGTGLTTSPLALGGLAILAGSANSVFHPANYAVLSAAVNPARMGRAFGVHTFAGHFGNALAPVTIVFLAVAWSWRTAVIMAGAMGLVVAMAMLLAGSREEADEKTSRPGSAHGDPGNGDSAEAATDALALFFSAPVMKLFLFFVLTAAASNGMQTFSVTALVMLFDTPVVAASAALTAFLFAMSMGVLAGGVLADLTYRYDLIAATAFAATAAIIAVVGSVSMPAVMLGTSTWITLTAAESKLSISKSSTVPSTSVKTTSVPSA